MNTPDKPTPPKPPELVMENFERAFSSHSSGIVRQCSCGKTFYENDERAGDWEDGELERLRANAEAIPLDYSVGTIYLRGREFAMDCECWHPEAHATIDWLQNHAREVADFLSLEKKRKQAAAAILTQLCATRPVLKAFFDAWPLMAALLIEGDVTLHDPDEVTLQLSFTRNDDGLARALFRGAWTPTTYTDLGTPYVRYTQRVLGVDVHVRCEITKQPS